MPKTPSMIGSEIQFPKGTHKVKKKLSDGRTKVYLRRRHLIVDATYFEYVEGEAVDQRQLLANFAQAEQRYQKQLAQVAPKGRVLAAYLPDYKRSRRHRLLVSKGQAEERLHLEEVIMPVFGDAPIKAFDAPRMRRKVREFHESMSETPRKADKVLIVFGKFLDFLADEGLITTNPARGQRPLHKVNRADIIWTEEEVEAVISESSMELGNAIRLALLTGAARTDLTRLQWSMVSERKIQFSRAKTGVLATVPLYEELQEFLCTAPRRTSFILTNQRGNPWTPSGLSASFNKARARAGIAGKGLHDLRGTCATHLVEKGIEVHDVARIVGWEEGRVDQIAKRYVSGDAFAEGMIARLAARAA